MTHMVPPALREVGQLMFKAVFQKFEHHADDHTHPPVPDHQSLTHREKQKYQEPVAMAIDVKIILKRCSYVQR